MQSISRDDLHRTVDAARASDLAVLIEANHDRANIDNLANGDDFDDDAPFLLVVVDTAGARFSVEGPMVDATEWRDSVHVAQCLGDRLNCFKKPGSSRLHIARVAQAIRQAFGYRHVTSGSIVRPARLRQSGTLVA